jgi:hypothetical protein
MTWTAIARENVNTAFRMIQSGKCDADSLEQLKNTFAPLSQETVSLRRAFIAECLFERNALQTMFTDHILFCSGEMREIGDGAEDDSVFKPCCRWHAFVSTLTTSFLANRNSTLREMDVAWSETIRHATQNPWKPCPHNPGEFTRWHFKNPAGRVICSRTYWSSIRRAWETKVLSDLLATVLARKTGGELTLLDEYTGLPYPTDVETGIPFSTGPDGRPDGRYPDDIRLGDRPK